MQQSKTFLPSIKFLLDSPIDDSHGNPFDYIHSNSIPITTNNNGSPYHQSHQLLPSISSQSSPDTNHHLAITNAHSNKQAMFPLYNPHPSNIKSLLSPPESPDMTSSNQQSHFDSYGVVRQEERYNVPQQQQQQCNCCINKQPSSIYSTSTQIMNNQQTSISNYNPYIQQPIQRYSSYPSTLPVPVSPYDLKSSHSFTRLNTSTLGLPTIKHYSQKNLASNGNSNGNRYQCPYCSKRFSRPSSLRIHIYSHTGEKPFACTEPGCGRKFSVQSNMRRHLRVHRLGRPVKKTRYDGEVEGVKILNSTAMLRSY